MRIISVRNINTTVESVRPKINQQNRNKVKSIILDLKKRKDKAIKEYEKKFTANKLKSKKVSQSEIKNAYTKVIKEQIATITISIQKVEKILGSVGLYVILAKLFVSDTVSIDMIAGPTELAIIADLTAKPDLVAFDLISQAEHSPETMCCMITNSTKLKDLVIKSLEQKITIIERSKIVSESLRKNGFVEICKTMADVIEFANKLAPEHLEIITKNPRNIAKKITASSLVLIGKNTPSSASDYLFGSNHILPTNGFGRSRGSLGVLDYMKIQNKIESTKIALQKISNFMRALTSAEGLPNYFEAVRRRLN